MQSRSFEISAMQEAMKNAKFVDFPGVTSYFFYSVRTGLARRIGPGKNFRVICAAGLRAIVYEGCPSAFAISRAQK